MALPAVLDVTLISPNNARFAVLLKTSKMKENPATYFLKLARPHLLDGFTLRMKIMVPKPVSGSPKALLYHALYH